MPQKWTLANSFASFGGAVGKNQRWSWSARTPDGSAVVMTFWKDGFNYQTRPPSYSESVAHGGDWVNRPGNKERIENLIYATENCDGIVHVVVVVAEDVAADPRKIAECYPQPKMQMTIKDLNRETGEFYGVVTNA